MKKSKSETIVIDYGDFKSILAMVIMGVLVVIVLGYNAGYTKPALICTFALIVFHIAYGEKYEFHEDRLIINSLWRPMTIQYDEILGMKKFHITYLYILYITGNQRVRILRCDFIHDKLVEKAVALLNTRIEHNHRLKADAQNLRAS